MGKGALSRQGQQQPRIEETGRRQVAPPRSERRPARRGPSRPRGRHGVVARQVRPRLSDGRPRQGEGQAGLLLVLLWEEEAREADKARLALGPSARKEWGRRLCLLPIGVILRLLDWAAMRGSYGGYIVWKDLRAGLGRLRRPRRRCRRTWASSTARISADCSTWWTAFVIRLVGLLEFGRAHVVRCRMSDTEVYRWLIPDCDGIKCATLLGHRL